MSNEFLEDLRDICVAYIENDGVPPKSREQFRFAQMTSRHDTSTSRATITSTSMQPSFPFLTNMWPLVQNEWPLLQINKSAFPL